MMSLARALVPLLGFAGFVALTLRVRPGKAPGGRVRMLVVCVVVVSTLAGLSGRDLWPFAAWHFVGYPIGDSGSYLSVRVVDDLGIEQPFDDRAFEPLEPSELWGWLDARLEGLPAEQRSALLAFLLARERDALARAKTGASIGTFRRILGPASAPPFGSEAKSWSDPAHLPADLTELRIYRDYWRVSDGVSRLERRVLVASAHR